MPLLSSLFLFFFFNDTATTEIYTLSLHDALPISPLHPSGCSPAIKAFQIRDCRLEVLSSRSRVSSTEAVERACAIRSEEHTSELQSPDHLVCRLLLEKKNNTQNNKKHSRRNKYVT